MIFQGRRDSKCSALGADGSVRPEPAATGRRRNLCIADTRFLTVPGGAVPRMLGPTIGGTSVTMSSSARALIAIVLLAVAANVQAEQSPPILERAPIPDFSKVEIKTTRLADDFYILEAPGGT